MAELYNAQVATLMVFYSKTGTGKDEAACREIIEKRKGTRASLTDGEFTELLKKLETKYAMKGVMDAAEISTLCRKLGLVITNQEVLDAIPEMDDDNNGEADLAEFCRWFNKKRGWTPSRMENGVLGRVHIRGIGSDWVPSVGTESADCEDRDGSDWKGQYEDETALKELLEQEVGEVRTVDSIRHRIDVLAVPEQNTSYAVVTFADPAAADAAVKGKTLQFGAARLFFDHFIDNPGGVRAIRRARRGERDSDDSRGRNAGRQTRGRSRERRDRREREAEKHEEEMAGEEQDGYDAAIPQIAAVVKMAVQAKAVSRTVQVTCPDGAGPGDTLEIEWEGENLEIEIPEGVKTGEEFNVEIEPEQQEQFTATVPTAGAAEAQEMAHLDERDASGRVRTKSAELAIMAAVAVTMVAQEDEQERARLAAKEEALKKVAEDQAASVAAELERARVVAEQDAARVAAAEKLNSAAAAAAEAERARGLAAMAAVAAAAAHSETMVSVVVPEGCASGHTITIAHDGTDIVIDIPEGVKAGDQFYLMVEWTEDVEGDTAKEEQPASDGRSCPKRQDTPPPPSPVLESKAATVCAPLRLLGSDDTSRAVEAETKAEVEAAKAEATEQLALMQRLHIDALAKVKAETAKRIHQDADASAQQATAMQAELAGYRDAHASELRTTSQAHETERDAIMRRAGAEQATVVALRTELADAKAAHTDELRRVEVASEENAESELAEYRESLATKLRTTSQAHETERDAVIQRAEVDKRATEALRTELAELRSAHEAAAVQSAAASESSDVEKIRAAHAKELEATTTKAAEAAAAEMARAQQLIRRAASAMAEQTQSVSVVGAHQAEIDEIRVVHAAELDAAGVVASAEASREAGAKATAEVEQAQRLIRQASAVLREQSQAKASLQSESKEHAATVASLQALTSTLEATATEKAAEAALHEASLRSEMVETRATHQDTVASLDDAHRQKLVELSAMHAEAMQSEQVSLRLAHTEELELVRASEASKLAELESSLRLELEGSSLTELRTSTEAQMQRELEELHASHAVALQEVKEATAAEAAEKEDQLRADVDELAQVVAIAAREVAAARQLSTSLVKVTVMVPDGVWPGDTLQIDWEGYQIEVEVPDGLATGDVFNVAIDPDMADAAAEWKAEQVAEWEAEQAAVSPEQVGRSRHRSRKALIRETSALDDHSLVFISHDHLQFSPGSTPDASPISRRGSPSPTVRPQSPLTLMPEASFTDGQPARPREVLEDMLLRLEQLQSALADSPHVPVTSASFAAEGVPPDSPLVKEETVSEAATPGHTLVESVDVSLLAEPPKRHVLDQSNEVGIEEGDLPQDPDEVLSMLLRIEELQQDLAEAAEAGVTPAKPQPTVSPGGVVLS